jgi:hypothetical protein
MLAAGVLSAACSGRLSPPSATRVPLGREFTLGVGQSVMVDDTGLRLSLKGVQNDSRCPVDVQCVWEGDAAVSVDVAGSSAPTTTYDLHTSGRFPREAVHGRYRIALVRLDPLPRSSGALTPADYRATFQVVR